MKTPGRAGWSASSNKPYRQSGKVSPRYRKGNPRVNTNVARADNDAGGDGASVLYRQRAQPSSPKLDFKRKMLEAGYQELPSGRWLKPKKEPPTKLDIQAYFRAGFPVPPVVDAMRTRIEERLHTKFWQNDRRSGYDHWHHILCHKETFLLILCFFCGDRARFVEFDWLYSTLRESSPYKTASAREIVQVCTRRKNWDRISWEKLERFPLDGTKP